MEMVLRKTSHPCKLFKRQVPAEIRIDIGDDFVDSGLILRVHLWLIAS